MASLGSELSVPHVGIGDESDGHADRGELVIPKSEAEISANEFASLQASDQRVSALKADMQRLHVAFVHEREGRSWCRIRKRLFSRTSHGVCEVQSGRCTSPNF
ncbi:Hypothetical Protein FCC1311_012072 [Hondaea fermentalgiana]|uniref:Uncharacterized protein n=1 Tax=Hondaea fermentalgiana TaxID=2315210 RepID=A0A2R5G1V7_9STRA|nr:Hypothetical Protein FCC1311_012072 [Hondaea fermentalgiana]|eukprot:GBG24990.1 Hypothetical Protein FCC1311_012072 [Hondaea fermentalgiana]